MKIQPITEPHQEWWQKKNTTFGILKRVKKRPYGDYLEGEYKGFKIEVYDAYKYNQLLVYVSKNMDFIKSKLIYWVDGVKKITKSERKINDKANL